MYKSGNELKISNNVKPKNFSTCIEIALEKRYSLIRKNKIHIQLRKVTLDKANRLAKDRGVNLDELLEASLEYYVWILPNKTIK